MKEFLLNKYEWTNEKFEEMSWHDCKIHAIAFDNINYRLLLDIDYILKWIGPNENGYYNFIVSPATLVFKNVYDIKIDIDYELETILDGIERNNETKPRNKEYINEDLEWEWLLETSNGEINFKSVGYSLFFRTTPTYREQQQFTVEERGGFSFALSNSKDIL